MARKHQNQPFSCENARFHTNLLKGVPHGPGQCNGSVFNAPLVNNPPFTLWLEYVIDKTNGNEVFWFMWYKGGHPTIPASGIFDEYELKDMIARLSSFIALK